MNAAAFSVRTQKSFLQSTGYLFSIQRLPRTSFVVQRINLPGISLNPVMVPTPFVSRAEAGDHLLYDELRVTFKVDEDLKNYLEIHNWLRGLGFPEEYEEYAELEKLPGSGAKSNALLVILDAKKRPRFEVSFVDCVPISLSQLQFESTAATLPFIEADVSFRYTSFSIQSI